MPPHFQQPLGSSLPAHTSHSSRAAVSGHNHRDPAPSAAMMPGSLFLHYHELFQSAVNQARVFALPSIICEGRKHNDTLVDEGGGQGGEE